MRQGGDGGGVGGGRGRRVREASQKAFLPGISFNFGQAACVLVLLNLSNCLILLAELQLGLCQLWGGV